LSVLDRQLAEAREREETLSGSLVKSLAQRQEEELDLRPDATPQDTKSKIVIY